MKKQKRTPDNPWDPPGYWERDPSILDWCAPEHVRDARVMERDYPRDDLGKRIPATKKDIIVDARPPIMIPPRPTYTIQSLPDDGRAEGTVR
jgi:hypothetical protein